MPYWHALVPPKFGHGIHTKNSGGGGAHPPQHIAPLPCEARHATLACPTTPLSLPLVKPIHRHPPTPCHPTVQHAQPPTRPAHPPSLISSGFLCQGYAHDYLRRELSDLEVRASSSPLRTPCGLEIAPRAEIHPGRPGDCRSVGGAYPPKSIS